MSYILFDSEWRRVFPKVNGVVTYRVSTLTSDLASSGDVMYAENVQSGDLQVADLDAAKWYSMTPRQVTMGNSRGDLKSRTARFAIAGDVAAYNTVNATFVTNISTKIYTFDMSDFEPINVWVQYKGRSDTALLAPHCLVVCSDIALSDLSVAAIMGTTFFDHQSTPAVLDGAATVVMTGTDGSNVIVLSHGDKEMITDTSGISYLYACAIDEGSGTELSNLTVRAWKRD